MMASREGLDASRRALLVLKFWELTKDANLGEPLLQIVELYADTVYGRGGFETDVRPFEMLSSEIFKNFPSRKELIDKLEMALFTKPLHDDQTELSFHDAAAMKVFLSRDGLDEESDRVAALLKHAEYLVG